MHTRFGLKKKEAQGNPRLIERLTLKCILFSVEQSLCHLTEDTVVYFMNRIMKLRGLILNIIHYLAAEFYVFFSIFLLIFYFMFFLSCIPIHV